MAGITKSVRLPRELIDEVEMFRGDQNFTEVVTEAVAQWLRRQRRRHEDQLIEQALTGLPPEQREAEDLLAGAASQSARRTLETIDDG